MKIKTYLIMMIVMSVVVAGACKHKEEEDSTLKDNPLVSEWNTLYGVPPFDKIKPEHYLPAFHEGIRQQKAVIDEILNNEETPTFANTIIPLEYSGELLDKISLVFFNLYECCNDEEMEKLKGLMIVVR